MFIYLEIATKHPYHTLKGKEKVCVQKVIKDKFLGTERGLPRLAEG